MPDRLCRHFGVCGGCSAQDVPYQDQLARKQQAIEDLLKKQNVVARLSRMHSSAAVYFYRNKMEFTFFEQEGRVICGLHKKGRHNEGFSLKECFLFSEDAPLVIAALEEEARRKQYPAYNKYTYQGFLRHLVVRESKTLPQIMVNLVTTSAMKLDVESLVSVLSALPLKKKIVSVLWTLNDSVSDAVVVQEQKVIFGRDYLEETAGDLRFSIFSQSFFQVNPLTLPGWYQTLRNFAGLDLSRRLLDLYSGIGGIGLYLSRYCDFVWGIELTESVVNNARYNAAQNGITNISFLAGDVGKTLMNNAFFRDKLQTITVNPPRCGLSNKIIKRLLDLNPQSIVYSSCNPVTFLDDAKRIMEQSAYRLKTIEGFDFFPHTPHLEVAGVYVH